MAGKAGLIVTAHNELTEGSFFHEKAVFIVKEGNLIIYQFKTTDSLTEEEIMSLVENTDTALEQLMVAEKIKKGQAICCTIKNGMYFDDNFIIDVEEGSIEMYMLEPKEGN